MVFLSAQRGARPADRHFPSVPQASPGRAARLAVAVGLVVAGSVTPPTAGAVGQSVDSARAAARSVESHQAPARSLAAAEAAYADGRFVEAAEIGAALGTSAGYVVATKSLTVYAHYEAPDEEYAEVAERAMRMGAAAVRADSSNADAHYAAAFAGGRYVQRAGAFAALRQGLAGKLRNLIETAIALDPDHFMAIVALGAWHADVAANGRMARMLYGGSREEAVALFERALQLAPNSKAVLYQYALRLPGLDEDGGTERARAMLERAVGLPVRDVYEDYLHFDVLDALDALGEGAGRRPRGF